MRRDKEADRLEACLTELSFAGGGCWVVEDEDVAVVDGVDMKMIWK